MITLEMTLAHLVHAFGWALIHFIWQGAVVALVLAGVLFVLEGYASNLRYGLALSAMLFMPVLVVTTTWRIWAASQEVAVYVPLTSPTLSAESRTPSPAREVVSGSDWAPSIAVRK